MEKEGVDYEYIIVKPILSDFTAFNGLSGYLYILSNKVAKKYLKMRNKDISEILGAFEKKFRVYKVLFECRCVVLMLLLVIESSC